MNVTRVNKKQESSKPSSRLVVFASQSILYKPEKERLGGHEWVPPTC